eukprot:Rhum_TRINITY_DN14890_c23_g1::Rhum_TRINITY_DN14890_c23_g1_i1::g.126666::m.126666
MPKPLLGSGAIFPKVRRRSENVVDHDSEGGACLLPEGQRLGEVVRVGHEVNGRGTRKVQRARHHLNEAAERLVHRLNNRVEGKQILADVGHPRLLLHLQGQQRPDARNEETRLVRQALHPLGLRHHRSGQLQHGEVRPVDLALVRDVPGVDAAAGALRVRGGAQVGEVCGRQRACAEQLDQEHHVLRELGLPCLPQGLAKPRQTRRLLDVLHSGRCVRKVAEEIQCFQVNRAHNFVECRIRLVLRCPHGEVPHDEHKVQTALRVLGQPPHHVDLLRPHVPLVQEDGRRVRRNLALPADVVPPALHAGPLVLAGVAALALLQVADELLCNEAPQGQDAPQQLPVLLGVHLRDGLEDGVLHHGDQHLRLYRADRQQEVQDIRQTVSPQVRQVRRHAFDLPVGRGRRTLLAACTVGLPAVLVGHGHAAPRQRQHQAVLDHRAQPHVVARRAVAGGGGGAATLRREEGLGVAGGSDGGGNVGEMNVVGVVFGVVDLPPQPGQKANVEKLRVGQLVGLGCVQRLLDLRLRDVREGLLREVQLQQQRLHVIEHQQVVRPQDLVHAPRRLLAPVRHLRPRHVRRLEDLHV